MEEEIVFVRKCPACGDTWIEDTCNMDERLCECFSCGHSYTSYKPFRMEYWIYKLLKTVKGN